MYEKSFNFHGSISLEVLNNYLDRAINYSLPREGEEKFEILTEEAIRFITNVGAKYICRAGGVWYPHKDNFEVACKLKSTIEKVHEIDPDVIFETAIFETAQRDQNTIAIPPYVFEAFGLTPENRNFNYLSMYDEETKIWVDRHEPDDVYVPDIRKTETQMFFYFAATKYIDAGFESLHLGQVSLMAKYDTANECWSKITKMIRDYAKTHARRGYVILNSHASETHYTNAEGVMLWDFRMAPCRVHAPADSVPHLPTEDNPQECIIEKDYWNAKIYQSGIGGTSPSGWTTPNYPYLVEFDNYGFDKNDIGNPHSIVWGMDEISWFCNQPMWYQKKFVTDLRAQIDGFNENGHISLNAHRGGYHSIKENRYVICYANNKSDACPEGLGQEDMIKEIFSK